jgi:methylthioribose-1-phosphate isomerase
VTHCNAGWLATLDRGTALAGVYRAHNDGIPIHVWVDETRPRNQGASLTAWELGEHGVPHTVIVDNAGGHLMREGLIDLCIVGTDRTTAGGDVANKIGTYLKALAARDNDIPFYVALPRRRSTGRSRAVRRSRSSAATLAKSHTSKAGPRRAGASPSA